MSVTPLYKLVLGNLWTAGYRPTLRERIRMQSEPGMTRFSYEASENDELVREMLTNFGYGPNETGTGLQILDMLPERNGPRPEDARPLAGHLIECAGHWCGDLIRIAGYYEHPEEGLTIGSRKAGWVGHIERMHFSLSCGGPSSHQPISIENLVPAGRTVFLEQWDFAMLPAAHSGVHWLTEVPVWKAETILFEISSTKVAA